jgi:co-chaperonin GroES (HSP10)
MALSQQEIKARALEGRDGTREKSWVSPHFGDGGWHTQPGALRFDPRTIAPLGDHILLELDSEPEKTTGLIVKPEIALNQERGTRTGIVLKVGPGKWVEQHSQLFPAVDLALHVGKLTRKPMTLKPGDRVVIGPHSDWESWDAWAPGKNVVLCQEADVRVVLEA